jgi:phosphatidate phosphatase LPIN
METTDIYSPYGTIAGTALDVIIVVPSPSSWCHDNNLASAASTEGERSSPNNGVVASSDFYVTFPSSAQYTSSKWPYFLYSSNNNTATRGLTHAQSDYCVDYSMESKAINDASNKKSYITSCVLLQSTAPKRGNVQIQINGRRIPGLEMKFGMTKNIEMMCKFVDGNGLRPPTHALETLVDEAILNYGRNLIRYILYNEKGKIAATAEAFLYMWSAHDYVIVSDVDGTITKSNVRGVLDTVVQDKFSHIHAGVCKFYHDLINVSDLNKQRTKNGGDVRFFYLSSRPISYIAQTRKLLVGLSQEESSLEKSSLNSTKRVGLPSGPIMCHRSSLSTVLHSELVSKNIYEFKADVLARQIVLPFVAAMGNQRGKPEYFEKSCTSDTTISDDRLFVAGFGNTLLDAKAYELAGMDRRDIYIINKESRIKCLGAIELQMSITDSSLNISALSCDHSECHAPDFCCASETNGHDVQELPSDAIEISLPEGGLAKTVLEPSNAAVEVSNTKTKLGKSMKKSAKQAIRAFTTKGSFPSFGSKDSSDDKFTGYDDPNLFLAVQDRMKITF